MNTGTVSQLPAAAGEVASEKGRGENAGSPAEANGFLRLVAKLAQDKGAGTGGGDAAASGWAGDGGRLNLGAWLGQGVELPGEEVAAGDSDAAIGDRQLAHQGDGLALQLALAGVGDAAALAQLLTAGGGPARQVDAAAIAARVANGAATPDDVALVRAALAAFGDGEASSVPDATILANLAKATSQAEARRAGSRLPETIGKVSLIGRETHLAPALLMAAEHGKSFNAGMPQAANPSDGPPVAINGEANLDAELVDPQLAVTAVRESRWGAKPQPDGSLSSPLQLAPDAAALDDGLENISLQAQTVVRADAMVSAGATGSVVLQIADKLAPEASALLRHAGSTEAPPPGLAQSLASPVKVIHIQLHPDGLGAVTVRLAVKNQALQLAVVAEHGETASLIQRERDSLSGLLRSAGYLIDGVDVRIAGPSGTAAPAMDGQAGPQTLGGGQSRGSQPDGKPSGAGPQNDPNGSGFGNRRNGDQEQTDNDRGRSGGLYV